MMLLWIAAAVGVGVLAWRFLISSKESPAQGEQSPEETLKQRYARGEIDDVEFERRMKALHQS
jgi:uncharacterized membrane protein